MTTKNNDKLLDVASYGLSLFSPTKLKSFLIDNKKGRKKKLLAFFQKEKEFYLSLLREGAWLPIPALDSVDYVIKVNDAFDASWTKLEEVSGFNIEVGEDNALWISDIGAFYTWDSTAYSSDINDIHYYTLDNKKLYSDFRFAIPSGKYLVTVECYKKAEDMGQCPQGGYNFILTPTSSFNGYLDPREDDKYDFNIRSLFEKSLKSKEIECP